MTFSGEIKKELSQLHVHSRQQHLALLTGLTHTCSSLHIGRGGISVSYQSEHEDVIRLATMLAGSLYRVEAALSSTKAEHLSEAVTILNLTGSEVQKLLKETGTMTSTEDGTSFSKHIPEFILSNRENARLYLRGCFLGGGSCADPSRAYHLEIVFHQENAAAAVMDLLHPDVSSPKLVTRRKAYIVYLRGEDEANFLAAVGAQNGLLKLEDSRAEHDFRNYINRKSNCETANIGKTVRSSVQQVEAIEKIQQHMDLNKLPAPLYEAAMLRANHPEATLQELADLAGIGKSGMNHRLTRLLAIAEELGEQA